MVPCLLTFPILDERDALSAQNAELSQKLASNEDSLTVKYSLHSLVQV